jgi:hypothetical protein
MALLRQDAPKRTTVYVDDVPVRVAEEVTGAEVLQAAGKNHQNYSLVTQDEQGGSQLVPSDRRIKPVEGQPFEAGLPGVGG